MSALINSYTNARLLAIFPERAKQVAVSFAPSLFIPRGTVLGQIGNINAVQSVTLGAGNTGGTFTLTFLTQTTTALAFNASAATVLAALVALSSIGVGNVTVTGSAGGPYTVTFTGLLAGQPVSAITGTGSLTGGANTVTIAPVTVGVVAGAYTNYSASNSDGSQVPKGLAVYDMVTDANGGITFTATSGNNGGNPVGVVQQNAPIYWAGTFSCTDLLGLDANAITLFGARIVEGNLSNGIVYIP